jgi:hypothetical protein
MDPDQHQHPIRRRHRHISGPTIHKPPRPFLPLGITVIKASYFFAFRPVLRLICSQRRLIFQSENLAFRPNPV